jgi:hypothetical protein
MSMHNSEIDYIKNSLKTEKINIEFYQVLIQYLESRLSNDDVHGLLHPLGFVILTLQDWCNGERLRIHIWQPDPKKYNNRNWIHDHEYNIVSLVLKGVIINKKFNCVLGLENGKFPVYNVQRYENNSDLFNTNKFCEISYNSSEEILSGNLYSIKRGEFHLSEAVDNEVTCTLVLNSDKAISPPTVIGIKNDDRMEFIYQREYVDSIFLKNLLKDLIKKLINDFKDLIKKENATS